MFLIRTFGGEVSWSSTLAVGSTYSEDDSSITHQIVDRPEIHDQILTRTYLQVFSHILSATTEGQLITDLRTHFESVLILCSFLN